MAKQLAAHDPPIPVAAVDATVEVELNARYGVPGFPTVFAFRGTTPVHYNDSHKNTQARAPLPALPPSPAPPIPVLTLAGAAQDMVSYMHNEHPSVLLTSGGSRLAEGWFENQQLQARDLPTAKHVDKFVQVSALRLKFSEF